MSLFNLVELRQPPDEFLASLDRTFFSIPKRWDSQTGKEILEILETLISGEFIASRRWVEPKWRRSSIPKLNWQQIAMAMDLAKKRLLELEDCGIRYRKEKERYGIRSFFIQEWRNPEKPWSPFLLACFGLDPQTRLQSMDGDLRLARFFNSCRPVMRAAVEQQDTICDSIFEE